MVPVRRVYLSRRDAIGYWSEKIPIQKVSISVEKLGHDE